MRPILENRENYFSKFFFLAFSGNSFSWTSTESEVLWCIGAPQAMSMQLFGRLRCFASSACND